MLWLRLVLLVYDDVFWVSKIYHNAGSQCNSKRHVTPTSPIPLPIHPSDDPKPTQQSSKTRSDRQPYQPQVLDEAVNTGGFHWMRSGAMYRFFLVLDFSRCWISVSGMTSLCSPLW